MAFILARLSGRPGRSGDVTRERNWHNAVWLPDERIGPGLQDRGRKGWGLVGQARGPVGGTQRESV